MLKARNVSHDTDMLEETCDAPPEQRITFDKKNISYLEITLASLIWGFSYVATKWALKGWHPLALSSLRFLVPAFAMLLFSVANPGARKKLNKSDLSISVIPGLLLGLNVVLWTMGLEFTSVNNSGFIFTLYVVVVPFISMIIFRTKFDVKQFVFILMAFAGTLLVSEVYKGEGNFNKGDLLTLACAMAAAAHIVFVEKLIHRIRHPFIFNLGQSIFAGATALVGQMIQGVPIFSIPAYDPQVIWGFIVLAVGTTLISNHLQVRAQRHLNSSTISLFTVLESPFASVFALIFLNEIMSPPQFLGGFLIVVAAIFTTRSK